MLKGAHRIREFTEALHTSTARRLADAETIARAMEQLNNPNAEFVKFVPPAIESLRQPIQPSADIMPSLTVTSRRYRALGRILGRPARLDATQWGLKRPGAVDATLLRTPAAARTADRDAGRRCAVRDKGVSASSLVALTLGGRRLSCFSMQVFVCAGRRNRRAPVEPFP